MTTMKTSHTVEEYEALRHGTGLIDYEGGGLFTVSGHGASAFLGHVVTRAVDFLLDGQISTSLLLSPAGTVVAEALVHCRGTDYLLEVWPAQAKAAGAHLAAAAADFADVTLCDVSSESRLLGLEGPDSFKIAQKFLTFPAASMAYRSFVLSDQGEAVTLISRTGVTGEYGFKLHVPAQRADTLRAELLSLGAHEVGGDAVDICRMEARFANLERESGGAEMTPFDFGLQWMVDLDRDFIGAEALRAGRATPATPATRLPVCWQAGVGTSNIPAAGASVKVSDATVGEVTHAVLSPKLGRVIGTARVMPDVAASGLDFKVGRMAVRTISAPFLVATSFGIPMD
jgi:aminomethyltransferase